MSYFPPKSGLYHLPCVKKDKFVIVLYTFIHYFGLSLPSHQLAGVVASMWVKPTGTLSVLAWEQNDTMQLLSLLSLFERAASCVPHAYYAR